MRLANLEAFLKSSFFSCIITTCLALVLTLNNANAAKTMQEAAKLIKPQDVENTVLMQLKDGVVVIRMFPDVAPNHVARIKELVGKKFYNNLKFHRVISGFMAQTGDPAGNGTGGSGKNIAAEFNNKSHKRGIVSMARASSPNSADSQFFIVTKDSTFLDRQYTAWGEVISGMEYVDKIKQGDEANNGSVQNPDKIISMSMAKDFTAK